MKNQNNNVRNSGIGFFGLLGIVFIVLKLVGVVNWSWWLVLAPLWAPTAVGVILILLGILVGVIADSDR